MINQLSFVEADDFRVVLVTSPHVQHLKVLESDFAINQSSMYTFSPIGLLMLAAVARKEVGVLPHLFDLNRRIIDGTISLEGDFYTNSAQEICSLDPHVVCFMTECDSYHHVLRIAQRVKQLKPRCVIELGGPHASVVALETLRECQFIDAILVGESEISFPCFLTSLLVGNDDKIPGVVRRSSTGELLDGGPALLVKSLDELPMPEYGLYPADSDEEIFIEVGRGCPFHCSFCSTAPYWNRVHRVKTPERIVAEIRCVRELYATKRFHFTHDLFTADRSWVLQVCQELIDSQLDIKWTCSSRTDTVDDMVLALMSKAGCDSIYFGLESGSERIQREIHKYIPLERSLQIIESCQSHNIHPNVGLIIGFQSEDEQSLRDTFQAFEITLRHGANPVHIFGFCPFKGSKLYPSLHDLQCTGHFLDLPLDNDLDIQNRLTIQSNVDLYGSYFRPRNQIFDAMVHNPISGVDEFSILVNIALIPSLILSDLMGGMYGLYTIWLAWIHKYNTRRDASPFREYYGSPLQYCFFLKECIDDRLTPAHFTHSYIRYLIANFSLPTDNLFKEAPEINVIPSSYEQSRLQDHILGDHISSLPLVIGNVISRMTLKHDVKQMLKMMASDLTHEPEARECCLIWQAQQDRIRLLEIDAFLYAVIDSLFQASPQSLDAIISNSKSVPQDLRLASGLNTNRIILNAIRMGLIAISPSLGVTSNDHVHVF